MKFTLAAVKEEQQYYFDNFSALVKHDRAALHDDNGSSFPHMSGNLVTIYTTEVPSKTLNTLLMVLRCDPFLQTYNPQSLKRPALRYYINFDHPVQLKLLADLCDHIHQQNSTCLLSMIPDAGWSANSRLPPLSPDLAKALDGRRLVLMVK